MSNSFVILAIFAIFFFAMAYAQFYPNNGYRFGGYQPYQQQGLYYHF